MRRIATKLQHHGEVQLVAGDLEALVLENSRMHSLTPVDAWHTADRNIVTPHQHLSSKSRLLQSHLCDSPLISMRLSVLYANRQPDDAPAAWNSSNVLAVLFTQRVFLFSLTSLTGMELEKTMRLEVGDENTLLVKLVAEQYRCMSIRVW